MNRRGSRSARGWFRLGVAAALIGGCATRSPTRATSLPSSVPTVRCPDPIEGRWAGQAYVPALGEWTRLSLTIRRVSEQPNRIVGEITARYWRDDGSHADPPRCAPGTYDRAARMAAEGSARGALVEFDGVSVLPVEAPCGVAAPPGSYAFDRVVGTVEPSGTEMRALDNDGDAAVDAPITLWRVACAQAASP